MAPPQQDHWSRAFCDERHFSIKFLFWGAGVFASIMVGVGGWIVHTQTSTDSRAQEALYVVTVEREKNLQSVQFINEKLSTINTRLTKMGDKQDLMAESIQRIVVNQEQHKQ